MGGLWHSRKSVELAVAVVLVLLAASLVQVSLSGYRDVRLVAMQAVFDPSQTNLGDPGPSIEAAARLRADPRAPLYDPTRTTGAAFIYPPLAALFYAPLAAASHEAAHWWLSLINHVLFVGIGLLAVAVIAARCRLRWQDASVLAVVLLTFYPLLRALELNQATILMTFAIGVTLLLLERGKQRAAGVAFALAVVFKPHMVLVLPLLAWHTRRMVTATIVTGVCLLTLSVVYAGVDNHVAYLTEMLPVVSRGYAFYPNQSWNGLLHRLSGDADIVNFAIAPASTFVAVTSTVLAAATYLAAIFCVRRWRSRPVPASMVFAFAWLATTLVSPVAWEHHYAPAIFLFALGYGALRRRPEAFDARLALVASVGFGLLTSYFEVRDLTSPVARVLVSYLFVGALIASVAWLTLVEAVTRAEEATP